MIGRPLHRLDDLDEALTSRARAMIWLGRYHRRSPGYYQDAGAALAELMADKPRALWRAIVQQWVGISPRRAYELIALAQGKPVAQARAETSARVRKHRRSKWLPTKASRRKAPKTPL